MLMWKLEQYDKTYLPTINVSKPSKRRAVRYYQMFFSLVYSTCVTLAVSSISLNIRCEGDASGLSTAMLVRYRDPG